MGVGRSSRRSPVEGSRKPQDKQPHHPAPHQPVDLMELKVKKFYHPPDNVFLLIKLLSERETPYKLENNFLTVSSPL